MASSMKSSYQKKNANEKDLIYSIAACRRLLTGVCVFTQIVLPVLVVVDSLVYIG